VDYNSTANTYNEAHRDSTKHSPSLHGRRMDNPVYGLPTYSTGVNSAPASGAYFTGYFCATLHGTTNLNSRRSPSPACRDAKGRSQTPHFRPSMVPSVARHIPSGTISRTTTHLGSLGKTTGLELQISINTMAGNLA